MNELKMWLRALFWTQLAVAAMAVGDLAEQLADGSWFLAALDIVTLTAVTFTAILAAKRYREIR